MKLRVKHLEEFIVMKNHVHDYELLFSFVLIKLNMIFPRKYRISTPLMMENPVRSPMVPPTAESMSTNFAALSFSILSNVGVSK